MNSDRVVILDTTLRDGIQCPSVPLNLRQKVALAQRLSGLGVDVIEVGMPTLKEGDFEVVHAIASEVEGPSICALAECDPKQIARTAAALKPAGNRARLHMFVGTSEMYRQHNGGKVQDEVLRTAVDGILEARQYVDQVQLSCEDATRTEPEFLERICQSAIAAGATTINIADSSGSAMPDQFAALVSRLKENIPHFRSEEVALSVHCHNDLGLAVANSLASIRAGARQVECTINGIGERAGVAALEEVSFALDARADIFGRVSCGIDTRQLLACSKLVSQLTRIPVQPNKALVGDNAFIHCPEANRQTIELNRKLYRVCHPVRVGWSNSDGSTSDQCSRAEAALSGLHSTGSDQRVSRPFGLGSADRSTAEAGIGAGIRQSRQGSTLAQQRSITPGPSRHSNWKTTVCPAAERDFEFLKEIGSGSYGEVWLAKTITGAYRAIKIVSRRSFSHSRPFDREFEGLQLFESISRSHSGWVSIFHVARDEKTGSFYYAMEAADDMDHGQNIRPAEYQAKSLGRLLARDGVLSLGESVRIGMSLAESVGRLHSLGYVHRDVKPSNIIFANGTPKLADIGLVSRIGKNGTFIGTEGFIPPEGPGTPTADIYALGKVIYQMATGCGAQQFPGLPTSINDRSDARDLMRVIGIVNRACERDPKRRYSSAEKLCSDLARLVARFGNDSHKSHDPVRPSLGTGHGLRLFRALKRRAFSFIPGPM